MLPVGFFIIALIYSIVGFGGGSSYIALLSLFKVPFYMIPIIGLICNLIVVSGGVFNFYKKKQFNFNLTLPLIIFSAPMAYLGGRIHLSEKTFYLILTFSLFISAIRLLITGVKNEHFNENISKIKLALMGSTLGFLAGLISLGGGIFLAPALLNLGWGHPREVSSTSCFFIFINSLFGIMGQLTKFSHFDFLNYWPLFLAVFLGGQIGVLISNFKFLTAVKLQKLTALLVLFISFNLMSRFF